MTCNARVHLTQLINVRRASLRKFSAPLAPVPSFSGKKKCVIITSDIQIVQTVFFFKKKGIEWRKIEGGQNVIFGKLVFFF